MSVLGFVFLIIITTLINVFVTAFLIARSYYSHKVLQHLKREAHGIIRTVNKATEEHVVIAESTIAELKTLLHDYKHTSSTAPNFGKKKSTRARLSTSSKRSEENSDTLAKNDTAVSQGTIQTTVLKMLDEGKNEAYIREHLDISKAELTLVKFMQKQRK